MSIDGLTTVEGVADFLDSEVVSVVPGELRSEVVGIRSDGAALSVGAAKLEVAGVGVDVGASE